MGMAVSQDDSAAYQIVRKSGKLTVPPFSQPVWMSVPANALRNSDSLPPGTKPFATALIEGTNEIVFTIGPDGDHLALSLDVQCRDTQTASTLLDSLEKTTANTSSRMQQIGAAFWLPGPSAVKTSACLANGPYRAPSWRPNSPTHSEPRP
jgi:hypothetical protein